MRHNQNGRRFRGNRNNGNGGGNNYQNHGQPSAEGEGADPAEQPQPAVSDDSMNDLDQGFLVGARRKTREAETA